MNKVTMSLGLLTALALSGAVASAEECRSPEVDVNTVAICGPFGAKTVPISEGVPLFDGEGASFVTGLGGNPVFLRVDVRAPATTAIAVAYDENGDASCFAQDEPGALSGGEGCDPDDVVTHDVRVFFPD